MRCVICAPVSFLLIQLYQIADWFVWQQIGHGKILQRSTWCNMWLKTSIFMFQTDTFYSIQDLPANNNVNITISWYTVCPKIFFNIFREMSGFVLPYGRLFSSSSLGSSVASASDARVSIIRLTHNICIAFSGLSCKRSTNYLYWH